MQVYSLGQNRNVRNTTLPRGSADLASTELAVCVSHGSFPRSATTSLFLWNGRGGGKKENLWYMRLQFQESPSRLCSPIFYWISILTNVYIFLSQISSFFGKSQLDVGRSNRYEADSVNLGKIEASADLEKNRKRACTVTNLETIAVETRWNEARTRP